LNYSPNFFAISILLTKVSFVKYFLNIFQKAVLVTILT